MTVNPRFTQEVSRFYRIDAPPEDVAARLSQLSDDDLGIIKEEMRSVAHPNMTPEAFDQAFFGQEGEGGSERGFSLSKSVWGALDTAFGITGNAFQFLVPALQMRSQHRETLRALEEEYGTEKGQTEFDRLYLSDESSLSESDIEKIAQLREKTRPEADEYFIERLGQSIKDFSEEYIRPDNLLEWSDLDGAPWMVFPLAIQELIRSAPYMAAINPGGAAVIATSIGNEVQRRRSEAPTMKDIALSLLAGFGVAFLQGKGAQAMLSPFKGIKDGALIKIPENIALRAAKGAAIAGTAEGITETAQQFIDNAASVIGTEKWKAMSDEEKFDALTQGGFQSAVLGSIGGGTLGAATGAISRPSRKDGDNQEEEGAPDVAAAAQEAQRRADEQQAKEEAEAAQAEAEAQTQQADVDEVAQYQEEMESQAEKEADIAAGIADIQAAEDDPSHVKSNETVRSEIEAEMSGQAFPQNQPSGETKPPPPGGQVKQDYPTQGDFANEIMDSEYIPRLQSLKSAESWRLHEEAENGTRKYIDADQFSHGQEIVIDLLDQPSVKAVVSIDSDGNVSAKDSDGRVFNPRNFRTYTPTEWDSDAEADWKDETDRLRAELEGDLHEDTIRDYEARTSDPEFQNLPNEEKSEIKKFIRDSKDTLAKRKESEKAKSETQATPKPQGESPQGDFQPDPETLKDFGLPVWKGKMNAGDLTLNPEKNQSRAVDAERLGNIGRFRSEGNKTFLALETADGTREVVDGHNRKRMMDRLVEKGKMKAYPEIDAIVLQEKEGWTRDKVLQAGAEMNIINGTATPWDIALATKDMESKQELKDKGWPDTDKKLGVGWNIGRLANSEIEWLRNEGDVSGTGKGIKEAYAAAVGEVMPGKDAETAQRQRIALQMIRDKGVPNVDQARMMASFVRNQNSLGTIEEGNLFGEDHSSAIARASAIMDSADRTLGNKKALGRIGRTKSGDVERENIGNINKEDSAALEARAAEAREVLKKRAFQGGTPENAELNRLVADESIKEAEAGAQLAAFAMKNSRVALSEEAKQKAIDEGVKAINDALDGKKPEVAPEPEGEANQSESEFDKQVEDALADIRAYLDGKTPDSLDESTKLLKNVKTHPLFNSLTNEKLKEISQTLKAWIGKSGGRPESGIYSPPPEAIAEYEAKKAKKSEDTETEQEAETATPQDALIAAITEKIDNQESMDNIKLFALAEEHLGKEYDTQRVYEAVEIAINRKVLEWAAKDKGIKSEHFVTNTVSYLANIKKLLPKQSRRTIEKAAAQQFSTPPDYAHAAAFAASIKPGDRVLEPSAGVGGLAVHAKYFGGDVIANEIDPHRAESLGNLGFKNVRQEDALHLADILERESFDVVLMNPPFSADISSGTKNSSAVGADHVIQGVKLLKPGGRLVAIMGEGFQPSNEAVAKAFEFMDEQGTIRAVYGIPGKVYEKYGTNFGTRMVVFDKVPSEGEPDPVYKDVADTTELIGEVQRLPPRAKTTPNKNPEVEDHFEGMGDIPVRQQLERQAAKPNAAKKPQLPPPAGGIFDEDVKNQVDLEDAVKKSAKDEAETETEAEASQEPQSVHVPANASKAKRKSVKEDAAGRIVYDSPNWFDKMFPNARPHLGKVVEAAAMYFTDSPEPELRPKGIDDLVESGAISDVQAHAIATMNDAVSKTLPDGRRQGAVVADGTGMGKTRIGLGLYKAIMEETGQKKALVLSENFTLFDPMVKDGEVLGLSANSLMNAEGSAGIKKAMNKGHNGILFTTYSTMGSKGGAADKQSGVMFPNVKRVVEYLGEDFDGLIYLDEAHKLASMVPSDDKGKRSPKIADSAAAFQMLDDKLPNARIVYASATIASKPEHLGLMTRLPFWGEGTPFSNVSTFISKISAGGLSAMELVVRDMKALGLYVSRSLSFEDVRYETLIHKMSDDEKANYDSVVRALRLIHQNLHKAADVLLPKDAQKKDRNKLTSESQFWSSTQRTINQILISYQLRSVIPSIRKDLDDGKAVVLQLDSTGEAAVRGAIKRLSEDDSLEDIDLTPREQLVRAVKLFFPVHKMKPKTNKQGNVTGYEAVKDSQGNPIENYEAVQMRNQLIQDIMAVTFPPNHLDTLIQEFGGTLGQDIAEVTGRRSRLVKDENGKIIQQNREKRTRLLEINEFQKGITDASGNKKYTRNMLIFSRAGGTGQSFHAEKGDNRQRVHYVFEIPWSAQLLVQFLGRTHRSNQESAPIIKLVSTDLPASMRKLSQASANLAQLGALSQGDRSASAGGVFDPIRDNFENQYGSNALDIWTGLIERSQQPEFGSKEVEAQFRLKPDNINDVKQFLNRLMITDTQWQEPFFRTYESIFKAIVDKADSEGTLDRGVEVVEASSAKITDEQIIHTSEDGRATTSLTEIEAIVPVRKVPFSRYEGDTGIKFRRQKSSKKVYAMREMKDYDIMTGIEKTSYSRMGPRRRNRISVDDFKKSYEPVGLQEARKAWNEEYESIPDEEPKIISLITGVTIPVMDRFALGTPPVRRVILDNGDSVLGWHMSGNHLDQTLANFGFHSGKKQSTSIPPEKAYEEVAEEGSSLNISNGDRIVPTTLSGIPRIEVRINDTLAASRVFDLLRQMGFDVENVEYKTRAFLPRSSEKALESFKRYMKGKEVVAVESKSGNPKFHIADPETQRLRKGNIEPHEAQFLYNGMVDAIKRILPHNVVVKMVDPNSPNRPKGWQGAFLFDKNLRRHIIEVATTSGNPMATLGHETIHALREFGLFSKPEWMKLKDSARKRGWFKTYRVKNRYPELFDIEGNPTERAYEEAVADAFADRLANGKNWHGANRRPFIFRMFTRMFQFFRNAAEMVRDLGGLVERNVFDADMSVEQIFNAIESGEISKRTSALSKFKGTKFQKGEESEAPPPPLPSKESEERTEKSRDVSYTRESFVQAVDSIRSTWHMATRVWKHLSETEKNSDIREWLIHLTTALNVHHRTAEVFHNVTKGMTPNQSEVFNRYMIFMDMRSMVKMKIPLSFGLKPEQVEPQIKALGNWINQNAPDLWERIDYIRSEKAKITKTLIEYGILQPDAAAKNEDHFRHWFLYKQQTSNSKGARKLFRPRNVIGMERKGSAEKDYVFDYIWGEMKYFEMALHDIAIAKFIRKLKGSKYNVRKKFEAQARQDNNAALEKAINDDPEVEAYITDATNETAKAYGMLRTAMRRVQNPIDLRRLIPSHLRPEFDRFIAGNDKSGYQDGANKHTALIHHLSDIEEFPNVQRTALVLMSRWGQKQNLIKKILGDEYIDPKDPNALLARYDPQGEHRIFQMDAKRPGERVLSIFNINAFPDYQMERMHSLLNRISEDFPSENAKAFKDMESILNSARTVRAVGGLREAMILSSEVADTLDNFHDKEPEGVMEVASGATTTWKTTVLFIPTRFLKYILNNFSGDIDALLAQGMLTDVIKIVAKEAGPMMMDYYNKGIVHPYLKEAIERGVLASQSVVELRDIISNWELKRIAGATTRKEAKGRLMEIARKHTGGMSKGIMAYLRFVQKVALLRENAFRVAAYIHYRRRLEAGASLEDFGFGATPPHMARAITDQKDLAARLARDTMGDYAGISELMRGFRRYAVPFVSWIYSNAVRYINIYKNALHVAMMTGRKKNLAAATLVGMLKVMRTLAMYMFFMAFNSIFSREEDERLSVEERTRLHLTLPFSSSSGNTISINFSGAFFDFASWFGVDALIARVIEMSRGRADHKDALAAIGKAPVNKFITSLNPIYKTTAEAMTGYQYWPDAFNPRHIRDPHTHHARVVGAEAAVAQFSKLAGVPAPTRERDLISWVMSLLFNVRDPGELSYRKIRGIGYNHNHQTKETEGSYTSPKHKAMGRFFAALTYGDSKSAKLAYADIIELNEGNRITANKSIKAALKRRAPLGMLSKADRKIVMASMNSLELEQLKEADEWYSNQLVDWVRQASKWEIF